MKERKERSYYYASPELENRNWVSDLKSPNARDCTAEVDVSIEMMPMDVAEQYKNGNGREGPNVYPNLPPPEGRETVMSRAAGAIQGAGRKYFWNYLKKLFAMYACYALGCLALAIFVYNYIMCDRCLF
jgi:hypothetical protein